MRYSNQCYQSYVRDDQDFLLKLDRNITEDTVLATFDVESLYTNIDHQIGKEAISFNGIHIERVISTKFLGVYLDESLKWDMHIEYCRKKVRSGLYALKMCKNLLTVSTLRMLYFSLVHPYLMYGNMLWGSAHKKYLNGLIILQKKAIRIITGSKYNEHSSPLFKRLNIVKLHDVFNIQQAKFVYANSKSLLPSPLQHIYTINHNVHSYNTRQSHDVHYNNVRVDIVFRSFIHKGPEIWSSLPASIKTADSLSSFVSRLKRNYIEQY